MPTNLSIFFCNDKGPLLAAKNELLPVMRALGSIPIGSHRLWQFDTLCWNKSYCRKPDIMRTTSPSLVVLRF